MIKKKNLLLIMIIFAMFFIGTKGASAADKSTLTCTYQLDNNSDERIVVEYDTVLKEFNVYKNNTISTNKQEYFDILFEKSDFSIKNNVIDCSKNPILYEYIVIESGKKSYDIGDDNYYYGPWNNGVNNGTAKLNKYNLINNLDGESSVGGSEFVPGSCIYKSVDGTKSVKLSLDESGKFNINLNTGEKEKNFKPGDEIKQLMLQQQCYTMAFYVDNNWWTKDKIWFANSIDELRKVYTGDITFEATLHSTTFNKTADESKQEVEDLSQEIQQEVAEIENLITQYESNNCVGNSKTDICKNLSDEIAQKMRVTQPKAEKLENNPYTDTFYGAKELLNKYKNVISSLSKFGFTQYSGEDLDCSSIQRFSTILSDLLKLIRVAGIVLFLALGIVDFAKAIISGEQDLLKKASGNFTKRAIAVVILFFLPIVLDFVLKLAGISTNPLCGIGL